MAKNEKSSKTVSKGKPSSNHSKKKYTPPGQRKTLENPFEKFANSKKKHEVVNRRVKGEDRDVGRARGKAIEIRKNKLIEEISSSKKSNRFQDRRFGENANLSLEEKMFLRFQEEKTKKAKKNKYNLDSAETPLLTHKGQVLGDAIMEENDWEDQSSDDENLGKDVVNRLHFGGGFQPTQKTEIPSAHTEFHSKSRGEILQEIVMKSKLYKMEKKEAKDLQETQLEQLDQAYSELVKSASLKFKPTKRDRSEDVDGNGEIDEYDKSLRVMAFESRVQPSNRTKTKEEIAIEEYEKLQKLEQERLKRMTAEYDPDEELINKALKSKKKIKNYEKNDDCIEDFYEGIDNHDQEEEDEDDDEEDDEDDDDEEDVELNSEDNDSQLDSESGEDEEDDELDDDNDEDDELEDGDDDDEEDDLEDDDDDDEEDESVNEEPESGGKKGKKVNPSEQRAKVSTSNKNPSNEMPHTIPAPQDIDEFRNLISSYVSKKEDFSVLVNRILTWNSVLLPGAKATNEKKMTVFFDILVNYLIEIGDSLRESQDFSYQLEHLGSAIFRLAADITDISSVWFAKKIQSMHEKLTSELQFCAEGRESHPWPSLGHLILIQQVGLMYSVTDFHHGIVHPMKLFCAQCLVQCPIVSTVDIASGLLMLSALENLLSPTKEKFPEIFYFLRRALDFISSKGLDLSPSDIKLKNSWEIFHFSSLESVSNISELFEIFLKISNHYLTNFTEESSNLFITQLISLLDSEELSSRLKPHQNIFQLYSLWALNNPISPRERKSLQWRIPKKIIKESLTPAYEVDYKMKTIPINMNPETLKLKSLNKQLKREQKASMRELRRDSEFLDQQNYLSKNELLSKKKEERARNYSWLEQEQATFNQQVRMNSKEALKGGGSGGSGGVKRREKRQRRN